MWISENIVEDWKTGFIVKLAISDWKNWRGIRLLSLTSKVFIKIIPERITAALEKKIRKVQAGFRKGGSGIDNIFTLRQILEQERECNSTVYANFIDFRQYSQRNFMTHAMTLRNSI